MLVIYEYNIKTCKLHFIYCLRTDFICLFNISAAGINDSAKSVFEHLVGGNYGLKPRYHSTVINRYRSYNYHASRP